MNLLLALLLFAAEPRWKTVNEAAGAAIKAKDYAGLRTALTELKPLMPGNPRVIYNLAASNAVLGNTAEALAGLRHLAAMGLIYDFAADEDFASLLKNPDFAAIQRSIQDNKKPVDRASPAFPIQEPDLLPEDIAYDPQTRRFFISSVSKSKIVTADGKQFAAAPWSILALTVDPRRRLLWAATAWVPHCEKCDTADRDKTALLAFDLATGALKQRIESPVKGLLGDMTISRNGDLYVSEGIYGAVLRLRAGASAMERIDPPGEFPSPQTPALSEDEKTLYVPDYVRGIAAIDLATLSVKWLVPSDDIALTGIDGLYVYRDSFLAVQNGTNPPRVMRFSLDLQKQEVIEANTATIGEPTHGVIVGDEFFYTANTGWSQFDEKGKKKPGSGPVHSSIRKFALHPPPGKLVDVGGRRLHLYCSGSGSPTVVVAGAGFSFDWSLVQPQVAAFTTICTYDPAGSAWSDPDPATETCQVHVNDLHTLLSTAGVKGPYVLTGFSIGALYARLYASLYPDEVAGMVMVDHAFLNPGPDSSPPPASTSLDSPPVLIEQTPIVLTAEETSNFNNLPETSRALHRWAASLNPPRPSFALAKECEASVTGTLRGMPVAVVSTANNSPNYAELQSKLLALSPNSKQFIAAKSFHAIEIDQPEIVVQAIREVTESVRKRLNR